MDKAIKFSIISALTSFAFWIPIFTVFMHSRALSDQSIYLLLTIYSFSVVIFEYPTGVIGDFFSHKLSATLGYLVIGLTNFLVLINSQSYFLYLGYVVLTGLGTTLLSGSDAAFRYSVLGSSFKRDYPRIKITGTLATLTGIISGPFLYQISPILPFLINGLCFLLAVVFMRTLPAENREETNSENKNNIFQLAGIGLKSIAKDKVLNIVISFSAIIATLAINMKWIYPTLFTREQFPITSWGILIASFYLARMLGTYYFKKFYSQKQRPLILMALVLSIILMGIPLGRIALYSLLFIEFFIVGILETDIDILILDATQSNVRASVLSFTSLVERLFSGLHIALLGLLSTQNSFLTFAIITSAMVVLFGGLAHKKLSANVPESHTKMD